MKTKTIIISLIIILLAVILFQNTKVVEFNLYFWKIEMSGIILYLIIYALGIITGYILSKFWRIKIDKKNKNETK